MENKIKKDSNLIIYYNNIFDKPIITLFEYQNNSLTREDIIIFDENEIEDGLPINIDYVISKINNLINIKEIKNISLLLSSNEIIKSTTALPKIPYSKALNLYHKDIKDSFSNYNDNFLTYKLNYKYNLGYIFYTYFIPLKFINFFKKLAYLLNIKLVSVDLYENYIFKKIDNYLPADYVYVYKDGNILSLLLVSNHQLSSFVTFKDENKETFILNYISYIDKHKFELEKKNVDVIYASQKIKYLDNDNVSYIEPNIDKYNFDGIKI